MDNFNHSPFLVFLFTLLLLTLSCGEDRSLKSVAQDEIVVRLVSSPTTLNPILMETIRTTEVNEYMYISLGDYNPITLELIPVLIKEIPQAEKIEEGPYVGGEAYAMEIKDGATWNDGSPITGYDILFTYKMATHPDTQCPGWKSLLEDVYDVLVDEEDPSRFTILTSGRYFLNFEGILSTEICPQYLLENSEVVDAISLSDLKEISSEDLEAQYPEITELGKTFSSVKYNKEIVEGAGPYELTEWSPEEYIVLSKKKDYWGDQYPENSFLQGNFERIIFQIIPDETVALTLLKNDEIDVLGLSKSSFVVYKGLSDDTEDGIDTYTSNSPINNMILLNNQGKILKDKKVREALVALTDVDRIIKQLEGGIGTRINSIINPNKPTYNKGITLPEYNIEKAQNLLTAAGWTDTNGDNIRDKIVDGVREELSLDFFITNSQTSEGISSILVQSAKEAGVEIKPRIEKFSTIQNEYLSTGNYDMSVMRTLSSASSLDPYSRWHSSSLGMEGRNYSRYSNPMADEQIERIRDMSISDSERRKAYYELQDVMAADYPVIFLYSPQGKYAIDDDIEPLISFKKPGAFINAFKMK